MASDSPYSLRAEALPDGALPVVSFDGEEAISTPFAFSVRLASDGPVIDGRPLLCRPATLDLGESTYGGRRLFHGVVAGFSYTGAAADGRLLYAATLRPRLWLLSRTRRSRVFATDGKRTYPEIVAAVLESDLGLGPADYDIRLIGDYPQREHVVQYDETDLAFVSRLLEHVGIAYFVEQTEKRARLVLTDHHMGFLTERREPAPERGEAREAEPEEPVAVYRPGAGMGTSADPAILSLSCHHAPQTRQAGVKEYNDQLPHVVLECRSAVVENGFGEIWSLGDHVLVPEMGEHLARRRLQEANCATTRVEGVSTIKALRAGALVSVAGHEHPNCNGRLLVVRVGHEGGATLPGVPGKVDPAGGETLYRNTFEAIPEATPFRPERTTPRPRIDGVISAFIDGAGPGDRAEIDEHGRYKVTLPFEVAGERPPMKASRWIRLAQPAGGAGHGFHFPLLKGTEVMLAHVGGDPDRPIIAGAVANPLFPSPVTSRNATRNLLRSASGVELEFNDGPGMAGAAAAPATNTLAAQRQAEGERQASGVAQRSGDEKWARVAVPAYDGSGTSYLRLGAPDPAWETTANLPGVADFQTYGKDATSSGWLDYTDGGRFSYTGGNCESLIEGDTVHRVSRSGADLKHTSVSGRHTIDCSFVDNVGCHWGAAETYFAGYGFEAMAGLAFQAFIGANFSIIAATDTRISLGTKAEASAQATLEYSLAEWSTIVKEHETYAAESITLSVDGAAKAAADAVARVGVFAAATVATAAASTVVGLALAAAGDGEAANKVLTDTGMGIAGAATTAGTVAAIYATRKAHQTAAKLNLAAPTIKIDTDKIELKAGGSSIMISTSGISMKSNTSNISMSLDPLAATINVGDNKLTIGFSSIEAKCGSLDIEATTSATIKAEVKLSASVGGSALQMTPSGTSIDGLFNAGG